MKYFDDIFFKSTSAADNVMNSENGTQHLRQGGSTPPYRDTPSPHVPPSHATT